ncbi:MAG: MFS transporter [Coriobacteriia bacterium]
MAAGRLWAPLSSADYRKLWLGQLVSVIGDKVDQIALGILVYQVTGSMLQMGVMLAVSTLPAALFGLVAGAFVDRWDRRRTMIIADVLRAGLVLLVPVLAEISIGAVYVVAFAVATVSLFFEPAKLSLIPDVVGEEQLMAANSLDNATMSVAELAGLAFAGGLVATVGYRVAFFFDAATYVVSAAFVVAIRHRTVLPPLAERVTSIWADVRRGLAHIRDVPVLRELLTVYSVASVGVTASITVMYLLALDRFRAGAAGLAALDAAVTVGLLLGSVSVGRTGADGSGRKFLFGLAAFALVFGATAFAPGIVVAMALLLVAGVANMWFMVPSVTLLQRASRGELRGRVFAAKAMITRIAGVIGFLGAGYAAERLGLVPTIGAFALLVLASALVGLARPALRGA